MMQQTMVEAQCHMVQLLHCDLWVHGYIQILLSAKILILPQLRQPGCYMILGQDLLVCQIGPPGFSSGSSWIKTHGWTWFLAKHGEKH